MPGPDVSQRKKLQRIQISFFLSSEGACRARLPSLLSILCGAGIFPCLARDLANMESQKHQDAFSDSESGRELGWAVWRHVLHRGVAPLAGLELSLPSDL